LSEREPTAGGRDGAPTLGEDPEAYAPSVAGRLAFYQRAGGIITPLTTTAVAFLMGGIVVLATGHNPLRTYKAIFEGAGLNWFFHVGNHHITVPFTQTHVWFWWDTNTSHTAAYNLTQTLLTTTPLILTGLAVAFAFRCGLFNIGGQGQYLIGALLGVYIGSRFTAMPHLPHVLFGIVAAALGGALWGAIAGVLKASVGAHEVITTIMLNWIAYWGGSYLVGRGGPLHNHVDQAIPVSDDVVNGAKLPSIWGNPHLQALHAGIFIALGALIVFSLILKRTTLGYEVRAVGFNPEAARYGGISVARNLVLAMTISGLFAGLAGALDIFGWQFRLGVVDVQVSNIGFIGIAVALLGRTSAVGVGLAALLFGALFTGTSTRSLDPNVFPPELAGNLALMIQALILLFVGADLVILYIWQARRKLRLPGTTPATKGSA
jgi:general nucleoside transport system permease protein